MGELVTMDHVDMCFVFGSYLSSACYNKILWTGWVINRNLFLTVLEAEKSNIKVTRLGESLLPGSQSFHYNLRR